MIKTFFVVRKCPFCGVKFKTGRIDKKFCSLSCTYRYHQLKQTRKELFRMSEDELRDYKRIQSLEAKKC